MPKRPTVVELKSKKVFIISSALSIPGALSIVAISIVVSMSSLAAVALLPLFIFIYPFLVTAPLAAISGIIWFYKTNNRKERLIILLIITGFIVSAVLPFLVHGD